MEEVPSPILTKRQQLMLIKAEMDNEFNSFKAHYQDLGDFIKPRRLIFNFSDANNGKKYNQKIVNCDPTLAHRTCRAGMTAGISPSSKPWFELTTHDPELDQIPAVKEWLDTVAQRMRIVFIQSNVYKSLSTVYGDVAQFGTAAMLLVKDDEDTIHTKVFPAGSYRIAVDDKGRVDKFHREFTMTARQIVNKFGIKDKNKPKEIDWSNISNLVQTAAKNKQWETPFTVCHTIYPNPDFNPNSPLSKHKRFYACYWELGQNVGKEGSRLDDQDQDKFLEEAGFDLFPVFVPRWEVSGEDAYATDCPAMTALSDIKQLQQGEKRKLEAVDKKIRPPMMGPTSLRNQKHSQLPGDMTYVDVREGMAGFQPAMNVDIDLNALRELQEAVQERIDEAFYVDLFAIFIADDRSGITATEIVETKEEKLILLGPVLESLGGDLHDKLIGTTYKHMDEDGQIPDPPRELQGKKLGVRYISTMHQAQKLIGIQTDERFFAIYERAIAIDPTVRHKVNILKHIEKIGERLSVAPGVLRTDEEAQALIQAEQTAIQQQQQAEMVNQRATAARQLAQAPIEDDNALGRVVNELEQAGA